MTPGRKHTIAHVLGTFELVEDERGRPKVATWPEGREALAIAVESAWAFGPEKFLASVLAGTGQGFEGVVSYGHHEHYPDEISEGCVRCSYFDEETEVAVADFEAYVLAYAELAAGTSDQPLSEATMRSIDALRARCKER